MSNRKILIYNDQGMNPMFVRANNALIIKYKEILKKYSLEEGKAILKSLWETEYKATLLENYIEFKDEKTTTIFSIKWER